MSGGDTVQIFHEKVNKISIACEMNLFKFPFDEQVRNYCKGKLTRRNRSVFKNLKGYIYINYLLKRYIYINYLLKGYIYKE